MENIYNWVVFALLWGPPSLHVSGEANSYIEDAKKLSIPRFLPTNENFNYNVGDTALLECAVENLGTKKVSWRKVSSTQVLTVGLDSFVHDRRLEVIHPPGTSQWNLVIREVAMEDAGVYECQVSSKQFHLRHHVTLLVKDEPNFRTSKKSNIQITGDEFVDEGESIHLTCNATAKDQPPEDLDWFREGNRLQTSEQSGLYIRKSVSLSTGTIISVLEIKKVRLKDAGVYVCRTSGLDVTSFRLHVLNGDTYNVKRGTEIDHTEEIGAESHHSSAHALDHCLLTSGLLAIVLLLIQSRFPLWQIT